VSRQAAALAPADAPFWRAADEGRLCLQRCDDCGFVRWPAAGVCPECLGRRATWTDVGGRGRVWSFAVYHRAYAATGVPPLPYNVALVELECGARLLSRIVDCATADIRVGLPVSVRFETVGEADGEATRVPVFAPAPTEATSDHTTSSARS
jgi:uncharacterized OB-fold protein